MTSNTLHSELNLALQKANAATEELLSIGTFLTVEQVAVGCNSACCNFLNSSDHTRNAMLPWELMSEEERNGLISRVNIKLTRPEMSAELLHNEWMDMMISEGWRYGPLKDVNKKSDPMLLSYNDLIIEYRMLDVIISRIVSTLSDRISASTVSCCGNAHNAIFRRSFNDLSVEEKDLYFKINGKASELLALLKSVDSSNQHPPNEERATNVSLAIRHLEDAVYRAIKGLTS